MVGHGFRLPCSDLDESDDDVLSVGPMQPLVTAAPLSGARRNDDGMIQVNSLSDQWIPGLLRTAMLWDVLCAVR